MPSSRHYAHAVNRLGDLLNRGVGCRQQSVGFQVVEDALNIAPGDFFHRIRIVPQIPFKLGDLHLTAAKRASVDARKSGEIVRAVQMREQNSDRWL